MRIAILGWSLISCLTVWSCGGGGQEERLSALQSWSPEAMGDVEPQIRRQFERALASLESRRQRQTDAVELAGATGALAMLHHVYGNHDQALAGYEIAEDLDPSDPRWPYYRGYLLAGLDRPEQAAIAYERALEIGPDQVAVRLRLAEIETDLGRHEAADRTLAALPPGSANSARGLVVAAELALAENDPERAAELFWRARELSPESNRIRLGLGRSLRQLGRLEEARGVLAVAGAVSPQDSELGLADPLLRVLYENKISSQYLWELGQLHMTAGRTAEATEHFRRALEIDPDSAPYRTDLGNALAAVGDLERALAEFETVLTRHPDYLPALASLGRAQTRLGLRDDAADTYQRLLDLEDEHPDIHLELANLYRVEGRFEVASWHYRRALEQDSSLQNGYVWLGMIQALQGDADGAQATFREGLQNLPESRWLMALEIRLRVALGGETAAAALLPEVMEVTRQTPMVFNAESLALAHALTGDFAAASRWQEIAGFAAEIAGADDGVIRRRLEAYREERIPTTVLVRQDSDTVALPLRRSDLDLLEKAPKSSSEPQ